MKLDIFYELAVPGHMERDEVRVYQETLDEIQLADTLGFNGVWLVEHHFMREYSHSSCPELFLSAASQRTKRLRLGHGVVVLPYNQPVRVAERMAALDVLSNGRVEFGIGRGFSPNEYATFGAQMSESRERVYEGLAILREAAADGPLHFQGKFCQADGVDVVPKPVQKPHPPLWTAAVSPQTFEWAAKEGIGAMAGPFKPWFLLKQDLASYRRAWQKYHPGPVQPGQNPRFSMTVGCLCLEDGDEARRIAEEPFTWYYSRLLKLTRPVLEQFNSSYEYYHKLRYLQPLLQRAVNLKLMKTMGMAVIGSPDECLKGFQRYKKHGVDHLILAIGAGGLPSSVVQESMRVIAEKVMPRL